MMHFGRKTTNHVDTNTKQEGNLDEYPQSFKPPKIRKGGVIEDSIHYHKYNRNIPPRSKSW